MRAYQRLLKYAVIPSAADPGSANCPSSPEQWEFARTLRDEMLALGVSDVCLDENCYLFGRIPANIPDYQGKTLGLIAHMDVTPDAPSLGVKPRLVNYQGGDILLNEEQQLWLRLTDTPALAKYVGDDLIVTDGTTLLGADDKAGIAAILTAVEQLLADGSMRHGPISIGFTPDEEIGRGADLFDVARFGADLAFTVDGAAFGDIDYETFSAFGAEVKITGVGIHPGEAKDVMVNAASVAMEFDALLPVNQRPVHTAGREGFYHLHSMAGQVEQASLSYILRDHDWAKLEQRCDMMRQAAEQLNDKYGAGTIELTLTEQYRNMAEIILQYPALLDIARDAVRRLGGEPISQPVRGGTDGSRLSYMGLPCPNLGTGSHNHHSRQEFASVQGMDKVSESLLLIIARFAEVFVE